LSDYGELGRLQRVVDREYRRGCRLIVCDAAEQSHLDQVAAILVHSAGRLLPVGSAGLATGLVKQLTSGRSAVTARKKSLRRLLLVCGTGSETSRRQVKALLNGYPGLVRELSPEWLAAATDPERHLWAAELTDAWTRGVLALQIQRVPDGGPSVRTGRAASGLARLALEIVRTNPVDGIFLSGGDTADAFRVASGGQAIRLEREVLPGVVQGSWVGGAVDGLPVVTKAGGFGRDRTLLALIDRLSGGETA
jgi:uncharacterized protein YgbK (DUF1537 family)